jgi:hypothetical protein
VGLELRVKGGLSFLRPFLSFTSWKGRSYLVNLARLVAKIRYESLQGTLLYGADISGASEVIRRDLPGL